MIPSTVWVWPADFSQGPDALPSTAVCFPISIRWFLLMLCDINADETTDIPISKPRKPAAGPYWAGKVVEVMAMFISAPPPGLNKVRRPFRGPVTSDPTSGHTRHSLFLTCPSRVLTLLAVSFWDAQALLPLSTLHPPRHPSIASSVSEVPVSLFVCTCVWAPAEPGVFSLLCSLRQAHGSAPWVTAQCSPEAAPRGLSRLDSGWDLGHLSVFTA